MSTGIIRRLDDLGRIVIPKELRRSLFLREGDALSITVDTDKKQLILTPYILETDLRQLLENAADALEMANFDRELVHKIRELNMEVKRELRERERQM